MTNLAAERENSFGFQARRRWIAKNRRRRRSAVARIVSEGNGRWSTRGCEVSISLRVQTTASPSSSSSPPPQDFVKGFCQSYDPLPSGASKFRCSPHSICFLSRFHVQFFPNIFVIISVNTSKLLSKTFQNKRKGHRMQHTPYYIKLDFSKLLINMIATHINYIFKIVTCFNLSHN